MEDNKESWSRSPRPNSCSVADLLRSQSWEVRRIREVHQRAGAGWMEAVVVVAWMAVVVSQNSSSLPDSMSDFHPNHIGEQITRANCPYLPTAGEALAETSR